MIRRFYIHNFRCLENFELPIAGQNSMLLIGKNGSGKSTVARALQVLQKIARGTNRVGSLVDARDLAYGRRDVPMRFELEVELNGAIYDYRIAFELPETFREMRVLEERFSVDGVTVYAREHAQVELSRNNSGQMEAAAFRIDWHLAALPIVQERSEKDPLAIFKLWLSRVLVLRPIPSLIEGLSKGETLEADSSLQNFGDWFAGLLAYAPKAYSRIEKHLSGVMPDFLEIRNPVAGKDVRSLEILFSKDRVQVTVPFEDLSDGEKCFFICAAVIAAIEAYGPLFCFWDEPDTYLAIDEVGHFITSLRKAFEKNSSQFLCTSHNSEAIRSFAKDNTLLLYRKSHVEPTLVRRLDDLDFSGNLVDALIRGDVEP